MARIDRSLLFVPANRPERFDKALASGADRVIVDLEDAVAPHVKDEARAALMAWLDRPNGRASDAVVVRVNSADTPWFADDLALAGHPGVAAVMLPKAEGPEALAALRQAGALALVPLIESAIGLAQLQAIAAAPGVQRLAFGSIDLQVDLGMRAAREDELVYFRSQLVLASRLAGLEAPIDGVTTALDDPACLKEDSLRARRLGFGGKLCIHPRQVAAVNEFFSPSAEELAWARRVLDAAAGSGGAAVAVDGKMVDKPVILRAQAILRDLGEP
jgi:citrate lyase subunit beta/citryl-CoA lyase